MKPRRLSNVSKNLLGASLAVFLLAGASARGQAGCSPAGQSPTAYTSPMTAAEQELQNFQKLQRLRDSGRLSDADYQKLVMGLASGNKAGVQLDGGDQTPCGDVIVLEAPGIPMEELQTPRAPGPGISPQRTPKMTAPVLSNSLFPLSTQPKVTVHSLPKINLAGQIQRPAGSVFGGAKNKEVSLF